MPVDGLPSSGDVFRVAHSIECLALYARNRPEIEYFQNDENAPSNNPMGSGRGSIIAPVSANATWQSIEGDSMSGLVFVVSGLNKIRYRFYGICLLIGELISSVCDFAFASKKINLTILEMLNGNGIRWPVYDL
ncbi:hypothetical protein [Burkholderia sp. BCC1644]|uniref:hypothetical protein n=1 Tax=Burkholderia sp. BCC1644 TaxID=2676293 RepID=UPI001ABA80CD|nr:hypothetical protein [Burkholderia sp. BCC1644]